MDLTKQLLLMKHKAFYKMESSEAMRSFRTGKVPGDEGLSSKSCKDRQDQVGPIIRLQHLDKQHFQKQKKKLQSIS